MHKQRPMRALMQCMRLRNYSMSRKEIVTPLIHEPWFARVLMPFEAHLRTELLFSCVALQDSLNAGANNDGP